MLREFAEKPTIEIALERHDQLRERYGFDPFPLAKLGMRRKDVDVGISPEEAGKVPVLVLSDIFAAPQATAERLGQFIFQAFGASGDPLDEVRPDPCLLLEFAKGGLPWIVLAFIDPALGHLPGFVGIIDPRSDEYLVLAVEEHHADSAAIIVGVRH